jgi:poly-gamma-glutamate synthesis protein (capsule biosynthesis protein)
MILIRTSKVKWLCNILLILLGNLSWSQSEDVSFLFVGDVMQHDGQIEAAYNAKTSRYEYDEGFKFVKPIVQTYDLRIANLEVTLAGKPYKGYPQFSAPDELAEALVKNGFNVILTANNHSCDRGAKGVERTLDELDRLGVKHTGTFRSKAERDSVYPLMIEEKGMKIAVLNYTYGTNGLTVAAPLIINYIDSAVIKKDVERAKELHADYIICTMHWGVEYKFLPNNYQQRFESWCYDLGVDMVIGGHPHVVQPIERKTVDGEEKLTVWSLGNFVSNMQTRPTRGGLMVGASVRREEEKVVLNSAEYYLVYVMKRKQGPATEYYILPDYDYNNWKTNFIDGSNAEWMKDFMGDSRALFAEHNKGVDEKLILPESNIGTYYNKLLTTYYGVELSPCNDDLLRDPQVGHMFHIVVDADGGRHLLCGVCNSAEQAEGVSHFVRDLRVTEEFRIVQVVDGNQVKETP